MNPLALAFTVVDGALLCLLPARWAALPLLAAAMYVTSAPVVEIGPAHFSVIRMVVTIGCLRVLLRGERVAGGLNSIDRWVLLWAAVLVGTSVFHDDSAWVYRAGIAWTDLGCYLLLRVFLQDVRDVQRVFVALCWMMSPLALLMLFEKATGQNPFAMLGGVDAVSTVRAGNVRASGPYVHAILAGTVGALMIPLALSVWQQSRLAATAGVAAGAAIVFASASTGPVLMLAFALLGRALWRLRAHLAALRWATLAGIAALSAVMNDPVYFIMARIDIAGGSTGWHRAQLLRSAIEHLDEWWLGGTDYTRHWMASGIYANNAHVDITNHFLAMGVMGGLPLMAVFIAVLVAAFRGVGRALAESPDEPEHQRRFVWTLGALLFGTAVNFMAISLFDQSVAFFYLVLAAIAAAAALRETQGESAWAPSGYAAPLDERMALR